MNPLQKDKIKMIAFDIDGTIFSSEEIILDVYSEAILRFSRKYSQNIKIPDKELIMLQIGKPVKTIFKNLLPELPQESQDEISNSVLSVFVEKIDDGQGHYYPYIEDTFRFLADKKYILTAASNGRKPYIDSILRNAKIDHYFSESLFLNYKDLQDKGDILMKYKQTYKLSGDEILMIGDRFSDRDAAVKSESPFAFCKYGHAPIGEVTDFSVSIDSLRDLISVLE